MNRAKALADYLEIPVEDITEGYDDNIFETSDGEEWLVATESEAYDRAIDDVIEVFNELGLESFNPDFVDGYILEEAVDEGWFEDALREMQESYVDDIADYEEERFMEEVIDAGIVEDEEEFNDSDIDELKEMYVDYLVETSGDPIEYYRDNFGDKDFSRVVTENNLIDIDKVAEECVRVDGIAHSVATYDGGEADLGDGLFGYRLN